MGRSTLRSECSPTAKLCRVVKGGAWPTASMASKNTWTLFIDDAPALHCTSLHGAELESKGRLTQRALDDFRNKYKFKRSVDGRVSLKSSRGEWHSVRLDMEVGTQSTHAWPCAHNAIRFAA